MTQIKTSMLTVTLIADHQSRSLQTDARSIADLLQQANVKLSRFDRVFPAPGRRLAPDAVVIVQRVRYWTQPIYSRVAPGVEHRDDAHLPFGEQHMVYAGRPGLRQTILRYSSVDGRPQHGHVISSRILNQAKPKIIAIGKHRDSPFIAFAQTALDKTAAFARSVFEMVATAYTPFCDTCSGTGRGASGMTVSHGVVAVDPHVIPLGTKLYIPGYGPAIAGDTGGAIIGNRIDLAFNSFAEAIQFGRRPITVYVLGSHHRP